jgi:hypothetical protein
MKLLITVTPHGMEYLSSHALRMYANKRRGSVNISQSQRKNSLDGFSFCIFVLAGTFKGQ